MGLFMIYFYYEDIYHAVARPRDKDNGKPR